MKLKDLMKTLLVTGTLFAASGLGATEKVNISEDFDSRWDSRVSIEFSQTDIKEALRQLARISGLNIITGEKITGSITARMIDVDLEEALSSIVRSCGYSYMREGDIIRVVTVPPEMVGIDRDTPQVLIESKIVEVVLGKSNESGVNWEMLSSEMGDGVFVDGTVDLPRGDSGLLLNIYNGDVENLIQMISQQSSTNILSSPRIVALDGREARILVGEKVAYQQSFGQASGGITTTTVNFEDVGIKLYVTPFVRPDDTIIIDILVEVSSVKEWRSVSNGDEIPIISTKQTTSRVLVRNNTTLIIGGLIGENRIESVFKVPVLGSIPLLKYLFSSRRSETTKTELTVFITPKLMVHESGGRSDQALIKEEQ
ncbi:MAG: type II and III secretion system protein [Candidatus Krumholzibacteriota bacterium]|nr:type II and III secretion system protein [Candidatus Krumholzibacteriota bacterium]